MQEDLGAEFVSFFLCCILFCLFILFVCLFALIYCLSGRVEESWVRIYLFVCLLLLFTACLHVQEDLGAKDVFSGMTCCVVLQILTCTERIPNFSTDQLQPGLIINQ